MGLLCAARLLLPCSSAGPCVAAACCCLVCLQQQDTKGTTRNALNCVISNQREFLTASVLLVFLEGAALCKHLSGLDPHKAARYELLVVCLDTKCMPNQTTCGHRLQTLGRVHMKSHGQARHCSMAWQATEPAMYCCQGTIGSKLFHVSYLRWCPVLRACHLLLP